MTRTAQLKLRKAGGSLIATVPKEIVEEQGLRAGDIVIATIESRGDAFDRFCGSLPDIGAWDRSWTRGRDRY